MYLPIGRIWSLRIGWILVVLGIALSPDVLIPTFTDIINFIIAMPISSLLGVSYTSALIMTWGLGIALFIMGVLVLPYNTTRFLRSRARNAYLVFLARPYYIIIILIVLFLMWHISDWVYITIYPSLEEKAIGIYENYKWLIGL